MRSSIQKIVQEKRRHMQRLRVKMNLKLQTMTAAHHYEEAIYQHPALLLIIQ